MTSEEMKQRIATLQGQIMTAAQDTVRTANRGIRTTADAIREKGMMSQAEALEDLTHRVEAAVRGWADHHGIADHAVETGGTS